MRKNRLIIIFLILIIAVLSVFLCFEYSSHEKTKEKLANINYSNWGTIVHLSSSMNNIKTPEDVKLYSARENAVMHSISDSLMPQFSGKGHSYILTVYYDSLVQDLAVNNIPDEYIDEAFTIFQECTYGIYEMSSYVLEYANQNNQKTKFELLDDKSEFCQEFYEKNEIFCETYGEKIKNFYEKIK